MDGASQSMTTIQNNSKSSPLDSKRGVLQGYLVRLFRSEDAVTGIAEAREDVAVVVELTVNSCNIDINIRMLLLHQLDSFRSSNQTHQSDVLASLLRFTRLRGPSLPRFPTSHPCFTASHLRFRRFRFSGRVTSGTKTAFHALLAPDM